MLPELPVAHPLIAQLPDESFLVVGARCTWTEAGPEENALLVGADAHVVSSGCLGDGLEHVQVAADGTIWVGYFDEGIFGNLGWGPPSGPTTLGAAGIVAWSATFHKLWELDPTEGLVADCYAFNVAAGVVWACTYTDFPVIRIADGQDQVFPAKDVRGSRGILATDERVALIGTYKDPSQLTVGRLTDGGFEHIARTNLWLPDGAPMPMATVRCRGSVAHFFADRDWFTYDLNEFDSPR